MKTKTSIHVLFFCGSILGGHLLWAGTVPEISIPKKKITAVKVSFEESMACSGFDSTVNPHSIMVPRNGNNISSATISPASVASKVGFLTNVSNAVVSPNLAVASPQLISITGVTYSDSILEAKTTTSGRLGALDVDVKSLQNQTVAIHAITQNNDDIQVVPVGDIGAVCVSPGPNGYINTIPVSDDIVSGGSILSGPNGRCETVSNSTPLSPANVPTAVELQVYLNSIWKQQANISFTVTRNDFVVNYDLNRNGGVDAASSGFSMEENVIRAAAKDSSVDINIYYVNTYLLDSANAATAGKETFIQDSHDNSAVNITAHEVGHALGIGYESNDSIDVMLSYSSVINPCNVKKTDWDTANP